MKPLALGMMSGTSCDGISLALCRFENHRFHILDDETLPYSKTLVRRLRAAIHLKAPELSQLNMELGGIFADAAVQFLRKNKAASKVAVIGSHGHTLYHGPKDRFPNTLQIGEASVIAQKTGITVVSDFRPRDMAAGGQGAPLIPFFDQYFFQEKRNIALLNIGGIANITFLGTNGEILAFDIGPGNCLIDETIEKITKGKYFFDQDGLLASQGAIGMETIKKMARHPYFAKKPPKSTGREIFNEAFLKKYITPSPLVLGYSPLPLKGGVGQDEGVFDLLATLTFFTAHTIYLSCRKWLPGISKLIVSGGGAKNLTLMAHLKNLFAPARVLSIEELGISVQAKEPAAFAFFAWLAIQKKINHAPAGTGARRVCILGKITY